MRIAVLVLGILVRLGAAVLAGIFRIWMVARGVIFETATDRTVEQATTEGIDPERLPPSWDVATAQDWIDGHHWQGLCVWFLLGAVVVGLLGAILGFTRRGYSAAALLFAAFAGPLLVYPGVLTVLLPLAFLIAGVLALLVRPLSRAAGASEAR